MLKATAAETESETMVASDKAASSAAAASAAGAAGADEWAYEGATNPLHAISAAASARARAEEGEGGPERPSAGPPPAPGCCACVVM